jgi:hypothetical protein
MQRLPFKVFLPVMVALAFEARERAYTADDSDVPLLLWSMRAHDASSRSHVNFTNKHRDTGT